LIEVRLNSITYLKRHKYSELKQTEKVREVDKLIDSIAKGSKKENQINNMKNKN